MDDSQLLLQYHEARSDEAFAEVVRRRLGMVYQAALRRTGGRADLAQDATQQVFTVLARNAGRLSHHPSLSAWLYTAARYASLRIMRGEARRHQREREAETVTDDRVMLDTVPVDELLDGLSAADRQAILLRFFDGRPLAEVASCLGIREEAARKRVSRALDKLRAVLERRGAASSVVAAELLLASSSLTAAPIGLSSAVSTAALAGVKTAGPIIAVFQLMSLSKIAASTAAAVIILGTAAVVGVGLAAHSYGIRRAALVELSETRGNYDSTLTRLQQDKTLGANVQREADRLATIGSAAGDPLSEGQQFLKAHPDIRAELATALRNETHRKYARFYPDSGLTTAQINRFESEAAEYQLDHLIATSHGLAAGDNAVLPKLQVEAIFGEQAFAAYLDFNRSGPAWEFTTEATRVFAADGSPLSDEDASRLAHAVLNASALYQSGQALDIGKVDWSQVAAQTGAMLSPSQAQALHDLRARYEYNAVLYQAMLKAREQGLLAPR